MRNFYRRTRHDDAIWEAGFESGVELAVSLSHAPSEDSTKPLADMLAKGALDAATGACQCCGSVVAMEFLGRGGGRPSLWLCHAHAESLTRRVARFPGDDPNPINPNNWDSPTWQAGFRTALVMPLPTFRDASREVATATLKRDLCTLCGGHWRTWSGGIGSGPVVLCHECLDHIREVRALVTWTRAR